MFRLNGAGVIRPAKPEVELHPAVWIVELLLREDCYGNDGQSGLFQALSDDALARRLTGAAFSSRKLRLAGQRPIGTADTDEVTAFVLDHGDADRRESGSRGQGEWGRGRSRVQNR